MFSDLELGHGRKPPRGPQAVVITQRHQAQFAATELTPQIPLHTGQIVRFGGDMEGIDHHLGRLIRWQRRQQLSPQLPPALTRQQLSLIHI